MTDLRLTGDIDLSGVFAKLDALPDQVAKATAPLQKGVKVGLDTSGVQQAQAVAKKTAQEVAAAFDKEQSALKGALDANLKATAQLIKDGKQGSDVYKKQVESLKAAKAAADEYDDALERASATISKQPPKPFHEVAMGAFAATAVVDQAAQAFNSLAAPSKNLDYVTGQLRTLGSEAADMSESLKASAIEMSKDLPFAASEIQGVMFDALASGVKGGEEGLKVFADTAAKLAVGGGAEIGEATGLLAGQMNAYGASSEQAAKYADTFFNIVNYGVTSVKDLSSTLSNVVPTAAAAGVSMENVGAALALMTQKGVPTAQSTTKLNQLLIELQKPAKDLEPILAAAGVSLESLKQDSLPETLGKVKKAIDATGGAAIQFFSSSEAAAAFSVLAGDMGAFEQTLSDVANTSGSAQNAFDEMAKTTQVQTDIMKSKMDAFLIKVADFAGPKVQAISGFAAELAPVATSLGALSTVAINAGKGIGSISTKVKDAGGWSGVFSKMGDGIKSFGASVGKTGKGIMSNLFSWKGAALGVAAALVAVMAGTEEGKAAMEDIQKSLGEALGGLTSAIAPVITELVDAVKPLLDGVAKLLGDVLGTLMTTVGGLLSSIFNSIGPVLEQLGAALVPVFEAFNSVLLPIIKTVSELIYGAFSEVGAAIGEISKALTPIFSELTNALKPVFETLTTTLTPIFKELAGTLGGVFQQVGTIFANIVATVAPIIGQLAAAFTPVIEIIIELQTLFFKTFIETLGSVLTIVMPLIGEVATMIGDLLSGALMELAPLVVDVATSVVGLLKGIASTVSGVVTGLIQNIVPVIQQLAELVLPIIKQLFATVQPIIGGLLTSIIGVIETLVSALLPVVSAVQSVLGSVVATLGDALTKLFAALAPVIGQLGGLLGQVMGIIGGVVSTVMTAILPVFNIISDVIALILPLIAKLVGTLAGVLGPVIGTLASVLGQLLGLFANLIGRVLGALSPVLEVVAELFGQILGVLTEVAGSLLNALAPVLDEIIGTLGELIGTLGQTVGELLIALLPAIELVVDVVAKLAEWLGEGLKGALTAIMPVIAGVVKILAVGLAKAIGVVAKLLSAVLKVISNVVKAIGQWLVGAVKSAVNWIKGAFASAVKFASDILNFFKGIINDVVGFFEMLIGWISSAIDWFLSFADNIPIVGDVIDHISAAIETFIGWIKSAIGWLAELFGLTDENTDKVEFAEKINKATEVQLGEAEKKRIPETGEKRKAENKSGGKKEEAKSDDPYAAELERLEEERKARELAAKQSIKDEEKLQEALLLLDEEYAKKREGVAKDFSDGTATILKDGKSVVVKATKEIQETATKDITSFGLEVNDAANALIDFASGAFDRLNEEIAKRREKWLEQGKMLFEIRAGLRLVLQESFLNLDDLKKQVDALRLTVDVAVGPILGGIEEAELRNALGEIGERFLTSPAYAEAQQELAGALADATKLHEEDLKKINDLDARNEAERAEARAEAERVFRRRQAQALQKFADAGKKIDADELAERVAGYEKYGTAVQGVLSSITDAVAGELAAQSEEQRKAHEERVRQYGQEEAILRKTLQAGQTTSADFVRQIDEMSSKLLEEEDVATGFWARFEEAGKAAITGLKTSLSTLRDGSLANIGAGVNKSLTASLAAVGGSVEVTKEELQTSLAEVGKSSGATLTQIGASAIAAFGEIAVSSENFWADTGKLLKNVASQALDALAPQILSAFVGFLGPLGIPAGLIALSLVKSAIASFEDGGLIKGGRQFIQANEKGEEYVVKASAVSKYGVGFLDAVNEGRLAIDRAGRLTRDMSLAFTPQQVEDLAGLAERVRELESTSSLSRDFSSEDYRRAVNPPLLADYAAERAALIEEVAAAEAKPDPYARQTAEATVALVDESRAGNEIQRAGTRTVANRLARLEILLETQNSRNSSPW